MIQSLQVLRGVAAILVVWYHIHGLFVKRAVELGLDGPFWFTQDPPVAKIGAIGVDIFFILSGFIIFYTTWDRKISWLDFAKRRFIRIYPLWWMALAAAVLMALIPGTSQTLDLSELTYSLFLLPYFNEEGAIKPVVEVGWTLNYEVLFYFVFSMFVFLPAKTRLIGVTAFFLLSTTSSNFVDWHNATYQVLSGVKTLEFVAGGWLALFYRRGYRASASAFAAVLCLATALLGAYLLSDYWRTLLQSSIHSRGLLALGILFLFLFYSPWSSRQYPKLWVLLGDASYSIYLFHPFVLAVLSGVWKRGLLVPPELLSPWTLWLSLLAAITAFGVVVHLLLEKPLLNYFRYLLIDRKNPVTPQLVTQILEGSEQQLQVTPK